MMLIEWALYALDMGRTRQVDSNVDRDSSIYGCNREVTALLR